MKFIQILTVVLGAVVGVLVFLRPSRAIEIQKRFYAMINWRIEPISMEKGLRNTRMMGVLLLVFAAAALIFILC